MLLAVDDETLKRISAIRSDFQPPDFFLFIFSGYTPPYRGTVSKRLASLYKYHQTKLQQQLLSVSFISLTCDFWSNNSSKSFLCLTAHYFTDDLSYRSTILSFDAFHDRHVAIRIGKTIQEKMQQFKIKDKVVAMTTDGATNMQAMIHYLDNKKINWIWCIAHKLHLVVNHAFGFWLVMNGENAKENNASSQSESTTVSQRPTTSTTTDVTDQTEFFDDSLEGKSNFVICAPMSDSFGSKIGSR